MSKNQQPRRKYRGDNSNIVKYNEQLTKHEKGVQQRRLKMRALCTHTIEPFTPALVYKDKGAGKVEWVCKLCGERVDLTKIQDDSLRTAIDTVSQACNLIKIMSNGSEKDRRVIDTVVADIQLKVNAFLMPLYKTALNSTNKQAQRRNSKNRSRVNWE